MDDESLKLVSITKEPGVADLPIKVRAAFGQAIKAERMGDSARAQEKLEEAIQKEAAG